MGSSISTRANFRENRRWSDRSGHVLPCPASAEGNLVATVAVGVMGDWDASWDLRGSMGPLLPVEIPCTSALAGGRPITAASCSKIRDINPRCTRQSGSGSQLRSCKDSHGGCSRWERSELVCHPGTRESRMDGRRQMRRRDGCTRFARPPGLRWRQSPRTCLPVLECAHERASSAPEVVETNQHYIAHYYYQLAT